MSLTEPDILNLIAADPERMGILRAVAALDLPDCWVGAGFVRNLVWDHLHGFETPTPLNDVDVIYFDPANISKETEDRIANTLRQNLSEHRWDVKNQARMHVVNNDPPYSSALDALKYWPETATAVAVRLWDIDSDRLELAAPLGIGDMINLIVRPTPNFIARAQAYQQRLREKNWKANWPLLNVLH